MAAQRHRQSKAISAAFDTLLKAFRATTLDGIAQRPGNDRFDAKESPIVPVWVSGPRDHLVDLVFVERQDRIKVLAKVFVDPK